MREVTQIIYTVDELAENIKAKVLDRNRSWNVEYHVWWDADFEDFKETNKHLFEITDIYFTGFYSQGDGAMFEYSGITNALLEQFIETLGLPEWKNKVIRAAEFGAKGEYSGNYYHHNSCRHWLDFGFAFANYPIIYFFLSDITRKFEDYIENLYEQLCRGLYKELENTYAYLTSDESVIESLNVNDVEFYENGDKYEN